MHLYLSCFFRVAVTPEKNNPSEATHGASARVPAPLCLCQAGDVISGPRREEWTMTSRGLESVEWNEDLLLQAWDIASVKDEMEQKRNSDHRAFSAFPRMVIVPFWEGWCVGQKTASGSIRVSEARLDGKLEDPTSGLSCFLVKSRTYTQAHTNRCKNKCTDEDRWTGIHWCTHARHPLAQLHVCAHPEFMSIIDTHSQMIGAACHSGIQAVAADKLVLLIAWGVNCSNACPLRMQQPSRTISPPSSIGQLQVVGLCLYLKLPGWFLASAHLCSSPSAGRQLSHPRVFSAPGRL